MKPVGDLCHENGIKLLLWFEPERVWPGTEIDKEHPEWTVTLRYEDGTVHANNRLFKLGDPEARRWMTERIDSLIKEGGVDIYRQDCNFNLGLYWEQMEADTHDPDRLGIFENQHVLGYLAFWDELLERNPGLLIDSCAAGGRRNDLETMRRSVPLHYSDRGYGRHPLKQRQHRLLFEWIPYFRAHNDTWDDGIRYYHDTPEPYHPDEFAYQCAMTPGLFDMTVYDDTDEQFAVAKKMTAVWRRAADLMLRCDYYPLTECQNDPAYYYAMEFYDDDTGEGFFQVVRNIDCRSGTFTAKLYAEDAEYELSDPLTGETRTVSGSELSAGYPVTLPRRSGVIWFMKRK
jgi:alpha-galactosidase